MSQVLIRNLNKRFGDGNVVALRNINLEIPKGITLAVLGPSGCGKTTLLKIIAGIEKPDSGEIYIKGKRIDKLPPYRRNIAMVFQNYALYPHMRVKENISTPLKLRRYPREKIARKVEEVARMLGIEELLERYPRQLSGGQQQRVALARAIVREPDLFLLDEPLSNLDAQVRETTRVELKKLFKKLGATVLYVTHDQIEAMTVADILAVMEAGTLRQIGPPAEIYRNPLNRFVAEFVGTPRINIISGTIDNGIFESNDSAIRIPLDTNYQGKAFLGIRPEFIKIERKGEIILKGSVSMVELMGHTRILSIRVGTSEIKVLTGKEIEHGTHLEISFSKNDIYLFNEEGERINIR